MLVWNAHLDLGAQLSKLVRYEFEHQVSICLFNSFIFLSKARAEANSCSCWEAVFACCSHPLGWPWGANLSKQEAMLLQSSMALDAASPG